MEGCFIIVVNKKFLSIAKAKTLVAVISFIIASIIIDSHISSLFSNVYSGNIGTVMMGIRCMSLVLVLCSLFMIFKIIMSPFIECAKHGALGKGKYLANIFKDHDDYVMSMETHDGRFELVFNTTEYVVMHGALDFFTSMSQFVSAIWIIWSFIAAVFYNSKFTMVYAIIAAIFQIMMFNSIKRPLESAVCSDKKEEDIY